MSKTFVGVGCMVPWTTIVQEMSTLKKSVRLHSLLVPYFPSYSSSSPLLNLVEAKLSSDIPASIPVLFMYGNEDKTCARSSVERSLKFVPHMRIFELFNVGHWVPVQAHETVSTAVAEFIRTTLREAGAKLWRFAKITGYPCLYKL